MANRVALTLIRHGQTEYNEQKRYLGWSDIPLSPNGIKELQTPSRPHSADLLMTSDLTRCKQTAQILFPKKKMILLSKIREFDFGDWEGRTYEQLKDDPLYCRWLEQPEEVIPPRGESLQQFIDRTNEGLQDILTLAEEDGAQSITVVTHGGVIRQWLFSYAPEERKFFEWKVPILSCFTMEGKIEDVRRGQRFTLLQEETIMEKTVGP